MQRMARRVAGHDVHRWVDGQLDDIGGNADVRREAVAT
jgi:hypothetical protein